MQTTLDTVTSRRSLEQSRSGPSIEPMPRAWIAHLRSGRAGHGSTGRGTPGGTITKVPAGASYVVVPTVNRAVPETT